MNALGHLCRELYENGTLTQRQLAMRLDISLGKCNGLVREGAQAGYFMLSSRGVDLTAVGRAFLEPYRVRNAFIYAAGIDVRFVPFTRKLPKSLLLADSERLIERQIRQLQEKNVTDITVIVGYLAEKMEYLVDKYNVKLLYNPEYATKSDIASLHMIRHKLGNSYLVRADYWLEENLFHEFEPESWVCCQQTEGNSDGWCLSVDGKRRVRGMQQGGCDTLYKHGPLYFDAAFATTLVPVLEEAYAQPGMATRPWEETLAKHLDACALYANVQPINTVRDFGSMEEMRTFVHTQPRPDDTRLAQLAGIMGKKEADITLLAWLEATVVNQLFVFSTGDGEYVCRLASPVCPRFASFKQEAATYKVLENTGLADDVIYFNTGTGTKISRYYPLADEVAGNNIVAMRQVVAFLRRLHESGGVVRHRFNIHTYLRQYDVLCRKAGCIHFTDYDETMRALKEPLMVIAESDEPLVLCHVNAISFDCIRDEDRNLRMGAWEYAGMGHALADIAMAGLYFETGRKGMDMLLALYLNRPATAEERLLAYSYAAVGGVLWSLLGEYCQHHGDDFGAYAVRMYSAGKRFLRVLGM